jgi:polyphosphate kinase
MPSNAPAVDALSLSDPQLYLDRELSSLAFQRRVLEEAQDPENALLERVKFLSILCSNLDEFFMVRVAILKQKTPSSLPDGPGTEHLDRIRSEVKNIMQDAYATWHELQGALAQAGIEVRKYADLTNREQAAVESYFRQVVYPVLTPLAFDPGRPFPHISNLSLNLAVAVRDVKGVERFARVKIPDTLPQLVAVPAGEGAAPGRHILVWLEELITENLHALFPGLEIIEAHPFRVTRDAEVAIQELESDDLLESVEEAVWQRRFRAVVRLQVAHDINDHVLQILVENLELDRRDVYYTDGALDLSRVKQLLAIERPDLKDPPFLPYTPPELNPKSEDDIFAVLRRDDVLLHHPYESFQPIVEFLRRAASDPEVLGRNSPVVEALLTAIENGKQVAVLVELKARFDEESNIEWARALEAAGVHVVYGLLGLKVHCKVAMVVRREGDAIRRYIHLGTGNYNPVTARTYTDVSLLTSDEQIGADVTDVFNYVTGYSAKTDFRKLLVAPINLRQRMEELIKREIDHAVRGDGGHLIFKLNGLEDAGIIKLLYQASQAGVRVDLMVRGVCCLRPGVEGVSDNISVTSIVGRFLEHSRIYYFRNNGREEIYLGSADLMSRNLNHRVEVLYPVENKRVITRIREGTLGVYLADNRNARRMLPDGSYVWDKSDQPPSDCQQQFLNPPRPA